MQIFKLRQFDRKARKLGINDERLIEAAHELLAGKFDAVLGGGVFKQRIARPGRGKSGGARVLVVFRSEVRIVFVEVFAKSDLANVSAKTLAAVREFAEFAFGVDDSGIDALLARGVWTEVMKDVEG